MLSERQNVLAYYRHIRDNNIYAVYAVLPAAGRAAGMSLWVCESGHRSMNLQTEP